MIGRRFISFALLFTPIQSLSIFLCLLYALLCGLWLNMRVFVESVDGCAFLIFGIMFFLIVGEGVDG